jgi:pilus assembly protein CpaE
MLTHSLAAAIVSPDAAVHRQLQDALSSGSVAETVWSISDYPELPILEGLREATLGCVLFLDFSDPVRARRIAGELDRAYPLVSVVALRSGQTKDDVVELMQLGVREVIGNPISPSEVAVAFIRASRKLKPVEEAGGDIYAFLPAKPGSGATTVAINTASAVARISGQKTLLMDFDLRLGITSFLLKLDGRFAVQDALNASTLLDADFWNKIVTSRDTLDILGSAPADLPSEPPAEAYSAVLNCAQARYAALFVDLAGAMERHELETMERAKEIFLVLTTDMTGLHMAKRKAEALQRLEFGSKVSAVINHAEKRMNLSVAEVEKLLQLPVRFILPSDQKAVTAAVMRGGAAQVDSMLGKQIEAIAKSITGKAVAKSGPGPTRRFIEFFSVSPARGDGWGQ